jgi:Ca2+-binding EF-hand superfamily protein
MSFNYADFQVIPESQRRRRSRVRVESKDQIILQIFEKIAGDDGVVDAFELQSLLQACFRRELGEYQFNQETCRSMVLLYDTDGSFCIEFEEFYKLWKDLKVWYGIFKKYDTDKSFDMNKRELSRALNEVQDLHISQKTIDIYTKRFANKNGGINLDDFLQIIARTKCLIKSFERQVSRSGSVARNPTARFSLEAYLQACLVS